MMPTMSAWCNMANQRSAGVIEVEAELSGCCRLCRSAPRSAEQSEPLLLLPRPGHGITANSLLRFCSRQSGHESGLSCRIVTGRLMSS